MSNRDVPVAHPSCTACGDRFIIRRGEVTFANEAGVPLWALCRHCRPTRRALAEANARLSAPLAEHLQRRDPRVRVLIESRDTNHAHPHSGGFGNSAELSTSLAPGEGGVPKVLRRTSCERGCTGADSP